MTTIPRHPVPADSYDAKRPLNDLLIEQFNHFKHIAASLPADLRAGIPPVPPIEDSEATGKFIAAVTRACVSRKKELPRIVPKPVRPKLPGTLSLAAAADTPARSTKSAPTKTAAKKKSAKKKSSIAKKSAKTKPSPKKSKSAKKKPSAASKSRRKS